MKLFTKVISMLLVASLTLAMLVVAVSAADPAADTKYSVDLSLEKNESDRFVFKAIRKTDGQVFGVQDTAKGTWKDTQLGFWVDDGETDKNKTGYTVYQTEKPTCIFDLMPNTNYNSVLAFKAPVDGYYDVNFNGVKYSTYTNGETDGYSYTDIFLTRGELAEVYKTQKEICTTNGIVNIDLTAKGIKLNAGEEVWVVVALSDINTRKGAAQIGVNSFDVTYLGKEDPGTYVPAEGTTYKIDLDMEKVTSRFFYLSALKKSDNTQANVEQTSRIIWTHGETKWPGFWVEGETTNSNYVVGKSERGDCKVFDQMCGGDYKSVIAFKAPIDGFYDIYYSAKKYQDVEASVTDIFLMVKGESEPLASKTAMAGVNDVLFNVKDVELKKGDEVWVVYTQNEANEVPGNSNLAVYAFDVTYVGAESAAPIIPNPGDVFKLDLSIEKATSKLFYISAMSKADDAVMKVEQTTRKSWSDKYPGFWVEGTTSNGYVVITSEKPEKFIFDQMCGGDYKSVLVFKAPVDGIYDIYYKATKYQGVSGSVTDITLMRTSSIKALASKLNMSGANEIEFNVKKVYLSAGEEVKVIYTQSKSNTEKGNSNLGVVAFDVTYVGEGERKYAVYDKLSFDLALDQKEKGQFKLAAILGDGTIDLLQDSLSVSYSTKDFNFMGWKTAGGANKSMFTDTQAIHQAATHGTVGMKAYFDMQPRAEGNGSPAIIFTAPKTGTYKFEGLFTKLKMWPADAETGNVYKVEAIVNGEVVATYTFAKNTPAEKHEDALLQGHVVLHEGETIMFVASHVSGGTSDPEIAVRNIDVIITSFGTTIPNPGTSDNVSVSLVLLALASLGIVVVSKKRRR